MKDDHRSLQLLQLGKESLKKNPACAGFEPLTSATLVQPLPIKLHRYRRGQGNESRTSQNFFFRLSFRNCKGCVYAYT